MFVTVLERKEWKRSGEWAVSNSVTVVLYRARPSCLQSRIDKMRDEDCD